MKRASPTIAIAVIYLAPTFCGVINNRLDPSLASGLTVAYLAAAGIVLGVLATGVSVLLSMRWGGFKPNFPIVAVFFVLSIGIFLLANRGALSVVQ